MEEIWGHSSLKKKGIKIISGLLYMYLHVFALTEGEVEGMFTRKF